MNIYLYQMVQRATKTEWRDTPENLKTQTNQSAMAYRYLGRTGMKVSVVGYGNWQTADQANKQEEVY
jgi:hypothetical protein